MLQKVGRPVHTLGGRFVRPRPVVPVILYGPTSYLPFDAQLDSAADDTVFPLRFATRVGIDLANAPIGEASGMTGGPVPLLYTQVELQLSDGIEVRRWPAWVGFGPIARPLLGFAGCLQFFTAIFEGDHERVEMTVNRLYPGT